MAVRTDSKPIVGRTCFYKRAEMCKEDKKNHNSSEIGRGIIWGRKVPVSATGNLAMGRKGNTGRLKQRRPLSCTSGSPKSNKLPSFLHKYLESPEL